MEYNLENGHAAELTMSLMGNIFQGVYLGHVQKTYRLVTRTGQTINYLLLR